jgi:putative endonuclease
MTNPLPPLPPDKSSTRVARGARAQTDGLQAEAACCAALVGDGWTILGQRLRTPAGEIDIVAEKGGLLAIVEVKSSTRLAVAAASLSARQIRRLLSAAEILIGENPGWGREGIRFDLMLVDADGAVRRVVDAFRQE